MIAIIDYGAGNLRSVQKAVEHLGGRVLGDALSPGDRLADKIILPGVGAFGKAVEAMDRWNCARRSVRYIARRTPFLGICLGMQLSLDRSEESPGAAGLGVLPGTVRRFSPGRKVPHLGWNAVQQIGRQSALDGDIPDQSYFYFAHSYYVEPRTLLWWSASTDYGRIIATAIASGPLFGFQFHPEKSQKYGLERSAKFYHTCEE